MTGAVEGGAEAAAEGTVPGDAAPRSPAELDEALSVLERRRGASLEQTLRQVVRIRQEAQALGDERLEMRAQLVQGDVLDRRGDVAGGAKLVWAAHGWATLHGDGPLLARSHYLLASTYNNLGDQAAALDHAVRAVELLDAATPEHARTAYLVKLGDAFSVIGSYDAARERYAAAERALVAAGDVESLVFLLNNLGYTEYKAGAHERADAVVRRMLALAEVHGVRLPPNILDTVARVHIARGRYAEAEQVIGQVVADLDAGELVEADSVAVHLLTLAETQRLKGDLDRAQESLDACLAIAEERGLGEVRAHVHEQQAEVLAASGQFEQAYRTYQTFHRESEQLTSVAREAAIRTRQALFETAEAREAAARFRQQALHDPLTGLLNRRYVDEQLPLMLQAAAGGAVPLSIALVDLDLFKVVNDRFSHETGDRVLVVVSDLLTRLFPGDDGEFVARMGGEEFLVVLPGADLAEAVRRMDTARTAVRDYPWEPLIGELVQTVSVGVAVAGPGSSQGALLREADSHLYSAKRRGRDRVSAASDGEGLAARRHNRDVTPD